MTVFAPAAAPDTTGIRKRSQWTQFQTGLSPEVRRKPWRFLWWDSEALRRRPSVGRGARIFPRRSESHVNTIFRNPIFRPVTLEAISSVWVPSPPPAIMFRERLRHFMQIVDLRQVHSRSLDVLFQEEARHWREELHWDYRPSIDLIRKFIDSRSLNGYLALDNGRPAGYGFYVLEDHKGLIGGLFVASDYAQSPITRDILNEMLTALRATPRLERIEAQL